MNALSTPVRVPRAGLRGVVALAGAAVLALTTALPASAAHQVRYPSAIRLPNDVVADDKGFRPEGIDVRGTTAYVGSLVDGQVVKADLRTGTVKPLVKADGDPAVGVEVTKALIVVAGGESGELRVYRRDTGAEVNVVKVADAGFVNDVAVVGSTAYFTDSAKAVVYALSLKDFTTVKTIALKGEFELNTTTNAFNGNGIVALSPNTLIVAQTSDVDGTGSALFRVDVRTGIAIRIPVRGGDVENADGLVLRGRTLWVVQNRSNSIAQLKLSEFGDSLTFQREIEDDRFDVPTTAAIGPKHALYTVNARFGVENPTDATRYDILRVPLTKR